MDINSFACLDELNRPEMRKMEYTSEQKHLYDQFKTFNVQVGQVIIHVHGYIRALEGEYTGELNGILKCDGGGLVRSLNRF